MSTTDMDKLDKETVRALDIHEYAKGVFQFAMENYETDGWDWIVDIWNIIEIEEEIKRCRTLRGAIKKMRLIAKEYDDEVM